MLDQLHLYPVSGRLVATLFPGVHSNFAWKDRASEKWDYQGIVVQHPSKEAAPGVHVSYARLL